MTAATGAARPLTGALNTVVTKPRRRSGSYPRYRFAGVDALPAVAAGLAVAYALSAVAGRLQPPTGVGRLLAGGFVSVDLLLVLAGFLIGRYLLEPGLRSGRLIGRLLRRFLPLHLTAWAIAFAWLGSPLAGTPIGTARGWVAGLLLISGFTRPDPAGYPLAGALSIGFWTSVAAVVLVAIVTRGLELLARLRPFGASARFGRANRISTVDPAGPVLLVALIALATGGWLLTGGSLLGLDNLHPAGNLSPAGTGAICRGLLGVGTGMLTVLWLRVRTGPVAPPKPKTFPRRRFPADVGAGLALAALLFCVYRTDLILQLHLLPLYPMAGALILFLAQTRPNSPSSAADPSRLQRIVTSGPGQWLSSRAWAIFVLHGAVLISVEQLSTAAWGILAETLIGTLALADLATRLLNRLPEPRPVSVPPPVTRLLNANWTPDLSTVPAGPVPTASPVPDAPVTSVLTTSSITPSTPPRSAAASPASAASAKTVAREDIPPELRLRPRIRKDVVNPRSSDPRESASSLRKEEAQRRAAAKKAAAKATLEKAAAAKAALEKAASEKAALEKASVEKASVEKAALEKAAATKSPPSLDLTGTTLDLTETDLTTTPPTTTAPTTTAPTTDLTTTAPTTTMPTTDLTTTTPTTDLTTTDAPAPSPATSPDPTDPDA